MPHAVSVAVVDGLFELFVREVEIALVHAHVEMLAAEVYGVRAGLDVGDECVPRAGGCEEFDGFPR